MISDGIIQNLPYSSSIIQNNDLLDAQLPVISQMTVVSGTWKIGDIVILNISSDGPGYSILPSSLINGIAVSEPHVAFTELSGGNYRLSYAVQEGDADVGPGALEATITLVKPSGNIGLPYSLVDNSANLTIDANPPVISQIELSQGEVGVGCTVRVARTVEGTG